MTAPPLKLQDRTCRAKRRFSDELAARAAALVRIGTGAIATLWVYRCTQCRGWHLTSKNIGTYWRVRAGEPYPQLTRDRGEQRPDTAGRTVCDRSSPQGGGPVGNHRRLP